MACVCGHEIELHKDEIGECSGRIYESGYPAPPDSRVADTRSETEPCECLGYEEDEDDGA